MAAPPLEVDPQEVKRRLDSGEKLHWIDVREPHEFAQAKIEGAALIPMRPASCRIWKLVPMKVR